MLAAGCSLASRRAMHRAAAVARHNLRACLIANTDDMEASEELIAHFLPWLSDALRADAVPRSNDRARQRHPTVVLPDGPLPSSLLPHYGRGGAIWRWHIRVIRLFFTTLVLHDVAGPTLSRAAQALRPPSRSWGSRCPTSLSTPLRPSTQPTRRCTTMRCTCTGNNCSMCVASGQRDTNEGYEGWRSQVMCSGCEYSTL